MPNATEPTCLRLSAVSGEGSRPSRKLSAPKMGQLTVFALFPLLPAEIRCKIWVYALQPRTVTIHYNKSSHSISSPTAIPRLLSVNNEARYEALRFCSPCLATSRSPACVYIASKSDTIYIPRRGPMGYDETLRDFKSYLAQSTELDDITELALDYVEVGKKRPWETYDKTVLIRSFPKLERVTLVLGWKPECCGNQNGRKEEVGFGDAKDDLVREHGLGIAEAEERIKVFESEFTAAWAEEERLAKKAAKMPSEEWEKWVLPELKVVGKMRKREFLKVL